MDEVIIYGAGKWGKIAYYYYENICNIYCFADNNEEKWGTFLHDKEIVSPEVLIGFKGKVIIAVQNGLVQIENELKEKYGICQFLEFGVKQRGRFVADKQEFNEKCIVMEYAGGLGNQLFQFALAKYLEWKGRKVVADITHYSSLNTRRFELGRLFKNNCLRYASEDVNIYFAMKDKISRMEKLNQRYVYEEPDITRCSQYGVSEEWGNIKRGVVKGYFQTYLFADQIRAVLLHCLEFPTMEDNSLCALADDMKRKNSVSIHIRRGDYLAESERRMDGICDVSYYEKAIQRIRESVKNPYYYIFSDDISWCKENVKVDKVIYIEPEMFLDYEDWYDMYLMCKCKHNIIANSSFSWWGAWLNENEDKIVIAPKKWDNFCCLTNICPPIWIRV